MKKKFKFDIKIILTSILLLLTLIPLFSQIAAFADPAGHNPMFDYLSDIEKADMNVVKKFLFTNENIISLTFLAIIMGFFILVLLDLIIRKKSTHILICFFGAILASAYALTRSIYCFQTGSISLVSGFTYAVSSICFLVLSIFFIKKTFDGDCGIWYYILLIVGGLLFFFSSATSSSYSILNAYSHSNDVVYWTGYAVSRFYLLLIALLAFINISCDYFPSNEIKEVKAIN
ncbi:MAG TPA: hypothetical protein DCR94_01650 [Firmicutes bacterium]|nr:hypothetical protein [Bacillota bacterium]